MKEGAGRIVYKPLGTSKGPCFVTNGRINGTLPHVSALTIMISVKLCHQRHTSSSKVLRKNTTVGIGLTDRSMISRLAT